MAFPDMVFSSQSIPSTFIGGRAFPVQKHIDYEWGPIAIQDPSKGSMYQIWRARMENNYVYLSAPNVSEFVLLDLPDVTEISFTFDQNGRHIFAYVQGDVSWLRWYDTSVAAYVTTVIDGITPRVTLDDKRDLQRSISDVLLFYVRDGVLYHRMQRDRYEIEYAMATGVTDGIVKCGMMSNFRVGVQLAQYSPATLVVDPQEPTDNVISLCHFDTESSDRVPDARLTSTWMLREGATISSTGGKFGGYLNAGTGRCVMFSKDITVSSEPLQLEYYAKNEVISEYRNHFILFGGVESNGALLRLYTYNSTLFLQTWDSGRVSTVNNCGTFDLTTFKHIAITISSGAQKDIGVFVDGIKVLSLFGVDVDFGVHINSQILFGDGVGAATQVGVRHFDEFRATREITYTSNFTPPQAPFE